MMVQVGFFLLPCLYSLTVVKVITPVQSQMGITGLGSSHKSLNSVDIVFHFTAASQRDAYWNLRCPPQFESCYSTTGMDHRVSANRII